MNLDQLIEHTRDLLGENQSTARKWPDAQMVRYLNSADRQLWIRAVKADESWNQDALSMTDLGAGQAEYGGGLILVTLPQGMGKIRRIEERFTDDYSGDEVEYNDLHNASAHSSGSADWHFFRTRRRSWWYGSANTIFMTKTDEALDLDTTRIWFYRQPPGLVKFTASTPTGNQVDVDINTGVVDDADGNDMGRLSAMTDAYKGVVVECVSEPASALPFRAELVVATYRIQMFPTFRFTTTTSSTASLSTTTWTTVPIWPSHHHELLCYLAARIACTKGHDRVAEMLIKEQQGERLEEFIQDIENRQLQNPRHVRWAGV